VPPDDSDLLDAARAGDRRALEALLVAHYDRVHALCRRMLGNETDAVDAAQDALLSAVRAISRFDGRSSFGTWIYRIATNACLDELRRRRRRPLVGLPADVDDDWARSGHTPSGPPGHGFEPAFGAAARDPADEAAAHVDVDAALRLLAPEHRVALVLRDVCDLPYEEIALILEVPIGTVRSRIARGRAALADLMTGDDEPGGQEHPGGQEDPGGSADPGASEDPGGREESVPGNASGSLVVKPEKTTEDRTR
jgi:RNA polymerase sigma-70 factor (ECF subfamily)